MIKDKIIQVSLSLITIVLAFGCVRSDYYECSVDLNFLYTNNSSNLDLLEKEVEVIDLYIYNKKDNALAYQTQISPKDVQSSITVPLYAGEYYAVGWGNIHSQTNSKAFYDYDKELRLLKFSGTEIDYNMDRKPIFHGISDNIIIDGSGKSSAQMSMTKNTKTVDISIFGNDSNVRCEVMNVNRYHTIENMPKEDLISIPEITPYDSTNQKTLFKINTHRLREIKSDKSTLKITSIDAAGGIMKLSLIDLIRAGLARGKTVTPALYDTISKELDRQDHFNIEIYLAKETGGYSVVIYVNGYLVISTTPDL